MRYIFYLFLLLVPITNIFSQKEYESIDYKNFQKAINVVDSMSVKGYENIDSLIYTLSGNYCFLGHLASPRQRKDYLLKGDVNWTPTTASLLNSLTVGKDILTYKEIIKDESITVFDYNDSIPQPKSSIREVYLPFLSPISIYNDILNNKQTVRYIGYDERLNNDVLVYSSSYSKQVTVYVNKENRRITSVQILKYEEIEGDYYLQFVFDDYKTVEEFDLPTKITIQEWGTTKYSLVYDYNIITTKTIVSDDILSFNVDQIAKNLYKISYPTKKHYSYILDYGDSLGIIEAPISEKQMEVLNKVIALNFPNKPVKYCFLTHHHPDHAGGFPYFFNNKATIVTTELSHTYQQELLNRKFSLRKGEIAYSGHGKFDVIHKGEVKDYSCNNLKMRLYEFGNSGHTTEFILYYFPQSKILIAGDLFYINSTKAYSSDRANRLYEFIKENNLQVKNIYTTWMPEKARIATIEDLILSYSLKENK